eukprot:scaffold6600_cov56-Phaeocystis_antarctica.AAC.2
MWAPWAVGLGCETSTHIDGSSGGLHAHRRGALGRATRRGGSVQPTWAIRRGRQVNTRIQSRIQGRNRAPGSARSDIATGITWVILHKPSTRERGSCG